MGNLGLKDEVMQFRDMLVKEIATQAEGAVVEGGEKGIKEGIKQIKIGDVGAIRKDFDIGDIINVSSKKLSKKMQDELSSAIEKTRKAMDIMYKNNNKYNPSKSGRDYYEYMLRKIQPTEQDIKNAQKRTDTIMNIKRNDNGERILSGTITNTDLERIDKYYSTLSAITNLMQSKKSELIDNVIPQIKPGDLKGYEMVISRLSEIAELYTSIRVLTNNTDLSRSMSKTREGKKAYEENMGLYSKNPYWAEGSGQKLILDKMVESVFSEILTSLKNGVKAADVSKLAKEIVSIFDPIIKKAEEEARKEEDKLKGKKKKKEPQSGQATEPKREKSQKTLLENYGVIYPFQSKDIQEKAKYAHKEEKYAGTYI